MQTGPGIAMALTGCVHEDDWSVSGEARRTTGGFTCQIRVQHAIPGGEFDHVFTQSGVFSTEHEAMIEGLREGMVWIGLKRVNAFHL
ncbi:UDP-glucose 4-epimerase [Paraburkholderia megapolitana]|jgi:hypothetical protein|uniref:UDP-glucose 4-epimerase n=1 Tax=Paraburkholderia megapolitana TaxID=420953 RepID=UPI0038B973AD